MEMQRSSTEHVAISSTKWLAQGHTLQKEKRKSSSFNALHQEERIGQQCLKAIRHGRFSSEDCWWQSKLPHLREVQKVGTIPARANPRGCLPASVFVGMASRMELRMADKHHALVRFFSCSSQNISQFDTIRMLTSESVIKGYIIAFTTPYPTK